MRLVLRTSNLEIFLLYEENMALIGCLLAPIRGLTLIYMPLFPSYTALLSRDYSARSLLSAFVLSTKRAGSVQLTEKLEYSSAPLSSVWAM